MLRLSNTLFFSLAHFRYCTLGISCLLLSACTPETTPNDNLNASTKTDTIAASPYQWTKIGENKHYRVSISAGKDRHAPIKPPIGQFHQWQVFITDLDQQPISGLQLRIAGGMPDHGHGLPSQPQLEADQGDGSYLISGMLFNMPGDWQLTVQLNSDTTADLAEFSFTVQP